MQAQTGGRREADLALLLRTLRTRGPLSRARPTAGSGLSEAAVSPLPANLEQRGPVERAATATRLRGADNHAGEVGHMHAGGAGRAHPRRAAPHGRRPRVRPVGPGGPAHPAQDRPRRLLRRPQDRPVAARESRRTAITAQAALRRVLDDPTVVPLERGGAKAAGPPEGASA